MKNLAVLGSTGSIGTQTLQVVEAHPERFRVEVLTANQNVDLLAEQALKFRPDSVVIANEEKYPQLKEALAAEDIKVYAVAGIQRVGADDKCHTGRKKYSFG